MESSWEIERPANSEHTWAIPGSVQFPQEEGLFAVSWMNSAACSLQCRVRGSSLREALGLWDPEATRLQDGMQSSPGRLGRGCQAWGSPVSQDRGAESESSSGNAQGEGHPACRAQSHWEPPGHPVSWSTHPAFPGSEQRTLSQSSHLRSLIVPESGR